MKNLVQPLTSFEDVISNLVFKEAGINDLVQSFIKTAVLLSFA
jgi:hypothetical protein